MKSNRRLVLSGISNRTWDSAFTRPVVAQFKRYLRYDRELVQTLRQLHSQKGSRARASRPRMENSRLKVPSGSA
jgi:hypothetical protein